MDNNFEKLKTIVGSYIVRREDLGLIERAFVFAKLAHSGQKRNSGDDFITHPVETAINLAKWRMDTASIVVGLLHDTIEHGAASYDDIIENFGNEIRDLVDGVTKVSKIKLKGSQKELFVENLRKMFLAMAKDLRVVIIRLAERMHNMQTLDFLSNERQQKIAKETLEIYAPIAERLGMGEVKAELEDLAFRYVYPDEYDKVVKESKPYYKEAEKHISKMKSKIRKALVEENIDAKIHARKKHLYSLWKKLERPEIKWDFEKIHDIVAIRILVEDIASCYTALGLVHSIFKPVPNLGVSDYIAQPKPNGYKSIHTKVFGPGERVVEIQIRTFEMHEENEHGVAAHWHLSALKNKGKLSSKDIDKGRYGVNPEKLKWVKQLAEWQKEIKNSEEFLKAVKFDALSQRIFVFSPDGDVFDLPLGATPIDYAYAVHTKLASFIKSAKVNGKIATLDRKLNSGDIVEIVKSKNEKLPNSDWKRFVVTTLARREIDKKLRKVKN